MVFPLNQILNVSPNIQIAIYLKDYSSLAHFYSMMLKNISFPLTVPRPTSIWGKEFLYNHLSFTAAYSLKSEKDWPVDFAKL